MNKELGRLAAVVIAILLLRIGFVNLYEHFETLGGFDVFEAIGHIVFDPLNLPLTISSTLLLGYLVHKVEWFSNHTLPRLATYLLIVVVCSSASTLIAANRAECGLWSAEWYSLFSTAAILCIITLVALYVWMWFLSSRRRVSKIVAKSERTQYRYSQLKRQLNPHFLFNSLSILDYLVQEQQTERASDYIKKLANIYRYLLKQEEYDTIELSKEVDFLGLYIDIMRERFLDGFEVTMELPQEVMSYRIVPCSLQVLVENAFKHNAVSPTDKLLIDIRIEGGNIVVSNNLHFKHTSPESTGYGLKNLRTYYELLSGSKIEATKTDSHFIVKIPLLK